MSFDRKEYMREYMERYNKTSKGREAQKRWATSPQGKKKIAEYRKSPQRIEAQRKYDRSEKSRENRKRINAEARLAGIKHYGGKCACCGEDKLEFLAFDHIDGGGNQHRKTRGTRSISLWLKRNNWPIGFRLLCHNCNQALGIYGYCPHTNGKSFHPDQMDQVESEGLF